MDKTYQGSCHCGAVAYEVTMDDPAKAFAGNCSICMRTGWLLTFVPAEAFRLVRGEGALRDYQFGKQQLHHLFCSTCGVRSFSRGKNKSGHDTVAVNLRCLEGLDATKLPIESFDCAKL